MRYLYKNAFHQLIKTKVFANFVNLSSIQVSNTLLLILIYPIIVRLIGIEAFGQLMVANAFAGLMGIFVNYGTSQTGTKDIAIQKNNPDELAGVFYNTLLVRLVIFILFLAGFILFGLLHINNYFFYLATIPLIFAEVINPMFLFFGKESLSIYNLANVFSKIAIILLILLLIHNQSDAAWINFYIGMANISTYLVLILIGIKRFKLRFKLPGKIQFFHVLKENSYLVGNNISVHLQQSVMLFILARWGTPLWLGAYSLCDKIVWSSRIMIMSVAGAVYPKSAQLHQAEPELWKKFRNKMQVALGALFLVLSLVLFTIPGFIIHIISGEANVTAITFLRIMAFVPTIAALNALNTVDLLLKNKILSIFRIAMFLLFFAVILAFVVVQTNDYRWFGSYTLIIEVSALIVYQYVVKKSDPRSVEHGTRTFHKADP